MMKDLKQISDCEIRNYFPASGTTITKRSLTPKEWDEQRQPQD